MGWLQSLFSPLKKLWFRLHSAHKKSRGIYILYEDVKSCPYEGCACALVYTSGVASTCFAITKMQQHMKENGRCTLM